MTDTPLVFVGVPRGGGIEIVETAVELGYSPVFVTSEEDFDGGGYPTVSPDALPATLEAAPAFVLGDRFAPHLMLLRLDRRWISHARDTIEYAESLGVCNWVSLVHPTAQISPSAEVGRGVFIGPHAVVSSHAHVSDFAMIGRAASLGHHSRLGTHSRMGPGVVIPGDVTVGDEVVIGPAATCVNGVRVADGALIGAGSVVTRHIRGPHQVMGNPARRLRRPIAWIRRAVKRGARNFLYRTGLYGKARQAYRSTLG